MSNDETPHVPAARDRREAVREKAQQVQAKQSRMRFLRRVLLGIGALVVVGAASAAVVWAFSEMGDKPQLQPATADADGFVVTSVAGLTQPTVGGVDGSTPAGGESDEPAEDTSSAEATEPEPTPSSTRAVDIRVYVDYLSSGAREFQLANAQQLAKWVKQEAASLTYHPVAMLTSKSNGTKYSLRAASAAACVATHSPETFFSYNDVLLRKQPAIDSDGMTDKELADLAQAAGVSSPKVVRSCIQDEAFTPWVRAATDRALDGIPDTDGVALAGTPTILVNGTPYVGALDDPTEFAQFVLTVASDAYYRTPTPTPSPTGSSTPSSTQTPTPAP